MPQNERRIQMTQDVLDALRDAAQAKGSPLNDAERSAVLATFPEAVTVKATVTTFWVPLATLLDPQIGNAGFLNHVETKDGDMVADLATRPIVEPIRVKKSLRVVDGFHRLAAAKARGDESVLCIAATLQEELSA
jgi:hypothetical protein